MEIRTKNAIKKIAAIGSGALMAATCFGVAGLATDLSDYPSPFVANGKWVGLIAVGGAAAAGDIIGATDIAATLAQGAGTGTGTTTITGGKEKELDLGNNLTDATNGFSATLDDDDLAGFQDTTVNIDIGDVEDDYDAHDELVVGNLGATESTIESGLTYVDNQNEDFKEDAFMAIPRGSIGYNYVFDDALANGNRIWNASDDEAIEINFLGKKLIMTGATATTLTAQVGEEFFLNVDDTVTILGHTVKLMNVGSGDSPAAIVVSVDGTQETVTGTEKVGTLRVKVKETFYSDTKAERSATLVIGEDASKTYDDGDEYIGEDEDDPNWVWDLQNLDTGNPTIGILFDQTYDDNDEVIKVGSTFALPNNYATIKLEGYTVNDTKEYIVDTTTGESLWNASGTVEEVTSAKVIHFHADGGGEDGFKVNGEETDDVYLYYNATDIAPLGRATMVYWQDHDDANKIKYSTVHAHNNTNTTNIFTIEYKDSTITVDGIATAAGTQLNLTIDEQANNDAGMVADSSNLQIFFETSGGEFKYIGDSDGDTVTANDIVYSDADISGWEENTRTQKGIIVHSYDGTSAGDEFVFDVPSDTADFAVKTLISSSGTKVTSTGVAGSLASVPVAKLDTEITDPKAQNLILVGGTAVNKLTALALGVTYPSYGTAGATALSIASGEATLKLVENAFGGTNTALIVAGWEAADTRNAAGVLKDYTAYSATLKGKQVVVKSTAGTITLSAPTVVTPVTNTTNTTNTSV